MYYIYIKMEDNLVETINVIENHLKSGDIQKSLDLIYVELKKNNTPKASVLLKQAEILIGRLGYLQKNIQEGVISRSETNLEYNKILKSVVELKQDLKRELEEKNQGKSKFSKKKLIIWFLPIIVGVVFFGYKNFKEVSSNENPNAKNLRLHKENSFQIEDSPSKFPKLLSIEEIFALQDIESQTAIGQLKNTGYQYERDINDDSIRGSIFAFDLRDDKSATQRICVGNRGEQKYLSISAFDDPGSRLYNSIKQECEKLGVKRKTKYKSISNVACEEWKVKNKTINFCDAVVNGNTTYLIEVLE